MNSVRLYAVAERNWFDDDGAYKAALAEIAACDACGVAIQVRSKGTTLERIESLASIAREAVPVGKLALFLNGPASIAARLHYEGLHWPEMAIPSGVADASPTTAERLVRSASVHSIDALKRAERAGADFVVFGPVFDAISKPVKGVGIPALEKIVTAARVPVLAIGGITPERVRMCLDAGANGVAVVSGVFVHGRIQESVLRYLEALNGAQRGHVA